MRFQTSAQPCFARHIVPCLWVPLGRDQRGRITWRNGLTPSHGWAVEKNAVFVEVGQWLRAQWYPKKGEATWRESVDREVIATRKSVGICDVSTLGKIDIQGRDAARFLNFVYANGFAKLAVGRVRYGLMLREDGICYDDGTTARLGENHFVMTTTTVNAGLVYRQLEFARQCLCPDFDVHLISVTDAWAQFAIAGPHSRDLVGGAGCRFGFIKRGVSVYGLRECSGWRG